MTTKELLETLKDICDSNTDCRRCALGCGLTCILDTIYRWDDDVIEDLSKILEERHATLRTSDKSSEENA